MPSCKSNPEVSLRRTLVTLPIRLYCFVSAFELFFNKYCLDLNEEFFIPLCVSNSDCIYVKPMKITGYLDVVCTISVIWPFLDWGSYIFVKVYVHTYVKWRSFSFLSSRVEDLWILVLWSFIIPCFCSQVRWSLCPQRWWSPFAQRWWGCLSPGVMESLSPGEKLSLSPGETGPCT